MELRTIHTGSMTSIHCDVLLSTNSPPTKFLVFPPLALVPFHSAEICSAFARAVELSALRGALGATVARERRITREEGHFVGMLW